MGENMKETEVTVQVFEEIDVILEKLKVDGYQLIEKYFLNDWYFSKFDTRDLIDMEYEEIINNSFLLRQIIDDKITNRITYKKKDVFNDIVISEEKTNLNIEDLNKALFIFNSIGLNNWCVINNVSYVFEKEKIIFIVQDIKDLGVFIEYEETKDMKNLLPLEKIDLMKTNLAKLNLKLGNDFNCKKVYMKFKQTN